MFLKYINAKYKTQCYNNRTDLPKRTEQSGYKLNNILTPYAHADGFLMIEKDKVHSKGNNGGKQKRPHKK